MSSVDFCRTGELFRVARASKGVAQAAPPSELQP
jgi:hypothetical protein